MANVTAGYQWTSGEIVTPNKLNSAATPTVAVADNEVTTAKIIDGAVTNPKLASGIDASKITTGTLPIARISDGGVTSEKLAVGVATPAGAVMAFAMTAAPSGWLALDGSTIGSAASGSTYAAASYSALFSVLWNNWTNSDLPILSSSGTTTTRGANASSDFTANKRLPLPDLRGYFVRGWGVAGSNGANGDGTVSGNFGTKQSDQLKSHTHAITAGRYFGAGSSGNTGWSADNGFVSNGTITSSASGGTETRPANIAMLYCIKF